MNQVHTASTPEWASNGMRAAMVKLSRALGHPNPVDCGAHQCVEAALIEMAAERLSGPHGVKTSGGGQPSEGPNA